MIKKIIPILFSILLLAACTGKTIDDLKSPQDNLQFIRDNNVKKYTLIPAYQQKLAAEYLEKYFSPWQEPFLFDNVKAIKESEQDTFKQYLKHPGWGENKLRYPKEWINAIAANANLDTFPNQYHTAITVNQTDVRALPTNEPSFTNWTSPGEGYPFDNLQLSHLAANTPLYVLHVSRDGAWQFVITPFNFEGWVPTQDIAYVDSNFIKNWMQKKYVTTLKENSPIKDNQGKYYFSVRLGQIYPLFKLNNDNYQVQIAVADPNRNAVIKTVEISKQDFTLWPLTANTLNIAEFANKFLGQPYGWGGLYGYRDCSSTLMDLFAAFGIWLPRSSSQQALQGQIIDLPKLTDSGKEAIIARDGIPFFTLISMPGHIVLYIGMHNNHAYAFQSHWAVHTYPFSVSGRSIIGRTAITSLDFGKDYLNTETTLLKDARKIIILVPTSELIHNVNY